MSNILSFTPRPKGTATAAGPEALSVMFANQRRARGDVFWLKENAEWLGILASMSVDGIDAALDPYAAFYDTIRRQLEFFPQYYRFYLSICLDLEDLGAGGTQGEALCHWVAAQGLVEAELSDLQRGEAARLLARRGVQTKCHAAGLGDRLQNFIARPRTFAVPNKKAAYELAHIVFYLSDYGRCDPGVAPEALTSLEYAGLLAFLDQDIDLLSEICAALRLAGAVPSPIWERLVVEAHANCTMICGAPGASDVYHGYLVTGWLTHLVDRPAFNHAVPTGQVSVHGAMVGQGALRGLSESLFELGPKRLPDWPRMRQTLTDHLSGVEQSVIALAEQSSPRFEAFFQGFSRACSGAMTSLA
ncbi:hypothetical protein SAMN04488040_1046 [Sulfitobacter marinus]|uniref:Uncharacterized protein n=1 Tax=Sulfitobacter marinus TaxID=394264 RepID=A0A1I6QXV8_9RHOB|nr:hypothetical protein [Sulfitobacter marinus]SFS57243.1 hypothetical protein SAMN04488040_1046 [Sulfitobacter marinus]